MPGYGLVLHQRRAKVGFRKTCYLARDLVLEIDGSSSRERSFQMENIIGHGPKKKKKKKRKISL